MFKNLKKRGLLAHEVSLRGGTREENGRNKLKIRIRTKKKVS